jgi:hypothetical protein
VRGRRIVALSRKPALVLVGAIVLAGCLHGAGEERGGPPEGRGSGPVAGEARRAGAKAVRSGPVAVEAGAEIDAQYVAGDRLYGVRGSGPVRLAAPVNTTLIATLSPAAVPAPGGQLLAYNSWRGRRPLVRLRDLETDQDDVLEEGALSVAWRRDGALAYFKALKPDLGRPKRYRGHVVVRRAPVAEPVRWTARPGRYVVAAWAGRRLLAYRIGSEWPDLLVLDGPGRARVLAEAGALVAISPDGGRGFVSTYGASPPLVRVLDLASGRELARRRISHLRWVSESGEWAGDLVAATASGGVAVFRVRRGAVALQQVLDFGRAGFTVGLLEPRLEDAGRRIVGWVELESAPREALPQAAVVSCERAARRCGQGAPLSTGVGVRLVYDPSRP